MFISTLRRWRPAALVVLLASALPTWAAAPFEKVLPEDTVAFVNIANVTAFHKAMSETETSKMLADPAMKPFVDGVTGEFTKLLDMAQQMTGISLPEVVSLPTGQVGIGVRVFASEPTSMPFVYFIAEVKGNEEKVKGLLDRLGQILEDTGMTKATDGDLTTFSTADQTPRAQPCFALKGGVLVIGNDAASTKEVVGALESGRKEKSLADNPRFQAFRQAAGGASQVEIYVDLAKTMDLAADVAGAEAGAAVAMLGLNAFQSAGFAINAGKDGLDTQAQFHLLIQGSSPLFNLINMPAKPIKPEGFVPESVSSYTSLNWDLDLFYTTLTNIINAVSPGSMAQVEAMLAGPDPDNPLVNIKNDLIGPLGNRLSIITDTIEEKDQPISRTLLAWELEDSAKLNSLIDRIMQLAGGALPLQDKMVKGNKVYYFPLGDLLAAQLPDQDLGSAVGVVGFSITKTHLMFATHVELLDKALESEGKGGLAGSADFQKVAAKLPPQVSMLSYSKGEAQWRAIYQLVKSGALAKQLRTQLEQRDEIAAFLGGIVDSLEGKNLPEFSAIKKYMTSSGAYAVMTEKGLSFYTFSLKQ